MNTDALSRYSTREQSNINLVRIYLQIITLPDMSLPDGNSACTHHLQGARRPNQQHRQKTWPRQDIPSALQLRLWCKYISSNFMRYSNKWKQALGSTTPRTNPWIDITLHHPMLQHHIKSLPLWYRHLLHDHQQTSTDTEVWRAFRSRIKRNSLGGSRNVRMETNNIDKQSTLPRVWPSPWTKQDWKLYQKRTWRLHSSTTTCHNIGKTLGIKIQVQLQMAC
jgi:hypothetical protein